MRKILSATSMSISSRGSRGGSAPRLIRRLRGMACFWAVLSFSAAAFAAASVCSNVLQRHRQLLKIEPLGAAAETVPPQPLMMAANRSSSSGMAFPLGQEQSAQCIGIGAEENHQAHRNARKAHHHARVAPPVAS